MLSCVSRWSSRVSVHSSHSGWSTSVWPDMMSNRSLVTLVGYDQRQSLFGFVTQIIHREINACLSPSVYDWGFPWCRHQMHLQWVWSCWRSLLTSFWGKARHSRLSNSVSFVGHASKKKRKKKKSWVLTVQEGCIFSKLHPACFQQMFPVKRIQV